MTTRVYIEHDSDWDLHVSKMDRTPACEGFPGSITNYIFRAGHKGNFVLGPNEKLIVQQIPHNPANFVGEKL